MSGLCFEAGAHVSRQTHFAVRFVRLEQADGLAAPWSPPPLGFSADPALQRIAPGHRAMVYYNKIHDRLRPTMHMHEPHPHHHHRPGQCNPAASISTSILRMSVLQRLAIAAALIALLWGAVIWAMKM